MTNALLGQVFTAVSMKEKGDRAGQRGCKYSREATVNAQIYIYFLIVSVVDHAKKWQKSNVTI